jgi:hypothetical protein
MADRFQFLLIAGAAIGFWGTVLYLAFRLVRAVEKRNARSGELEELRARVGEIEQQLAVSRAEIERLGAAESHAAMMLARLTDPARGPR